MKRPQRRTKRAARDAGRGRPADGEWPRRAGVPGQRARRAGVVRLAVRGATRAGLPVVPRRSRRRGGQARRLDGPHPADSGVAVRTARLRVAGAAALFVAGFTAVFVLGTVAVLGMTTTLITNQLLLQRIGGVLTIVMGLVFVGFIPVLQRDARFAPRQLSTLGGAPLLGAVFALGWTPCLGPTLTGVIAVASATDGANVPRGVALVIAYCLGLGIPFVLLAFGSARAVQGLAWLRTPRARHPDLRRRAAHPRRRRVGHRCVERLRVLGARRVRQRRDLADMTNVSPREDAKTPETRRVGELLRVCSRGEVARWVARPGAP